MAESLQPVICLIVIFVIFCAIIIGVLVASRLNGSGCLWQNGHFVGGDDAAATDTITNIRVPIRQARVKDLSLHPRSKSEQRCIDVLEKTLGRPFPTAYPKWLQWRGRDGREAPRPMELDGYNEELGIALEFSGPLHTKHYPDRESYIDYFDRVCKDMEKIKQCRENNVHLIVVDMRTPAWHIDAYIKSRLADIGAKDIRGTVIARPFDYMPAVVGEPYRNRTVEHEAGLVCAAEQCSDIDVGNNDLADAKVGAADAAAITSRKLANRYGSAETHRPGICRAAIML